MTIDFGSVEKIEEVIDFYSNLTIADLAKKYFVDSKIMTADEVSNFKFEFDGIDEDLGYMIAIPHDGDVDFYGFSDGFVATFTDDENAKATIDPIWINIIAKNLHKISGFKENQYIFDVYQMVEELEAGEEDAAISADQAQKMKDCLFAIEAGVFTPDHQTMTEAEKIAFMSENVD